MKATEALIAWTPNREPFLGDPTRGQVQVGPLLGKDDPDWTRPFAKTGGAAYTARATMDRWEQIANVFLDFHGLVFEDEIDAKVVHAEFLKIDEYRDQVTDPPHLRALYGK